MAYSDEIIIGDRFAKMYRRLASVIKKKGDMTKYWFLFVIFFHLYICTYKIMCIIVLKMQLGYFWKNVFVYFIFVGPTFTFIRKLAQEAGLSDREERGKWLNPDLLNDILTFTFIATVLSAIIPNCFHWQAS